MGFRVATGKIQKFVLRDREWAGYEIRIYGGAATSGWAPAAVT